MKTDLESMLAQRKIAMPSADFAQRIILRAQRTPQVQPLNLTGWLARLFGDFMLPRPACAMACVLALGILVGFGTPTGQSEYESALLEEGAIL